MRRHPCLFLMGISTVSLAPTVARAEEANLVAMNWSAPAGCPSQAEVEQEIQRLLGDHAVRPRPALDVRIRVTLEHSQRWQSVVQIDRAGSRSERTVQAASCDDVAQASALVVALAIDPGLGIDSAEPGASDTTLAEPRPNIALGPMVLVGPLPESAYGPRLTTGFDWDSFSLFGFFEYLLPRTEPVPERSTAQVEFSLVATGLGACWLLQGQRASGGLCADLEVGRIYASSSGVDTPGTGYAAWLAAGSGGVVRWTFNPSFSAAFGVTGLLPLHRPRFVIEGVDTVFQVPSVGLESHLQVALSW